MPTPTALKVLNIAGFNLIWFLAIVFGNSQLIGVAGLLILHFVVISDPLLEIKVVAVTALVGYSVDCVLTLLGVFRFEHTVGLTPFWLVLLWVGFCTTLRHSLSIFYGRYLLASIAGAVAGATTYLSAAYLGAVDIMLEPAMSFALLAFVWAFLFPCLLWISQEMSMRYATDNRD